MNYRVIALDLDGTLLTSQKTILADSLHVLARARQAGCEVIIVTGRHHIATRPFYQTLALNTPAICCNGTYLYDFHQKKVLQSAPIRREQAEQVLILMAEHQIHGFMYIDDAMIYDQPTDLVTRMQRWSSTLAADLQPDIHQVTSLQQTLAQVEAIWKFAVSDTDSSRLQRFAADISEKLALECEWSWLDQLDVAQCGNNKGQRLAQWAADAGIAMSEIIAFGDNYNDISMLENVGLGVAMANADQAVKARAKLVTGDNNSASIARVLQQYVL